MRRFVLLAAAIALAAPLRAEIQTKEIEYKDGKTALQGFLAWDDAAEGDRPGVFVVHEWWGHGDYVRERARQLAELGYVAFAGDMYGKGVYATDHKKAMELSGVLRNDRDLMRRRAWTGVEILKKQKGVDKNRIAAIGYCFGGTTVLELARAGRDLAGVVSLHGGLGTPAPEKTKNVKAKVLVCHGAADPHVKQEEINGFKDEMTRAGADWQMNVYGGAVHSFTVAAAGDDPSKGMAYDERADRRSWAAMKLFFDEIFR